MIQHSFRHGFCHITKAYDLTKCMFSRAHKIALQPQTFTKVSAWHQYFQRKNVVKKNYFLRTKKNNFFKKILLIMFLERSLAKQSESLQDCEAFSQFFIFLQKYYSSIRYVCNLKIFLDSLLTTTYLKTESVAAVYISA